MDTKKKYIAPNVKIKAYRTEDGFYATSDLPRFDEALQLDFFSTGTAEHESWEEQNLGTGWDWQ